jgi:hypothetical protein
MPDLPSLSFLVVSDLYDRYTVVVSVGTRQTSVYCEECEMWVNSYEGDQLSTQTQADLLEKIVEDHNYQVNGTPVTIADPDENFL